MLHGPIPAISADGADEDGQGPGRLDVESPDVWA